VLRVELGTGVAGDEGVTAGGTVANAAGEGMAAGDGIAPQLARSKARTEVMVTSVSLPR